MAELGVKTKRENYVQEFRDKRHELPKNFESHLIGPLQSNNKVKEAVRLFWCYWIGAQLKDPDFGAARGWRRRPSNKISFCKLISLSRFEKKRLYAREVFSACEAVSQCPHVRLRGLMTITELYRDPEQGGLWHGAGWTFVFWGFLHGMALIIHRVWTNRI